MKQLLRPPRLWSYGSLAGYTVVLQTVLFQTVDSLKVFQASPTGVVAATSNNAAASNNNNSLVHATAELGMLCREPDVYTGGDVEVVFQDGGMRSLVFSRMVSISHEKERIPLGREVTGIQSTVRCMALANDQSICAPKMLLGAIPNCSAVNSSASCGCMADTQLPPAMPYQQQMAGEVLHKCKQKEASGEPFRALVFGLGAGAMQMYLRHQCKVVEVESIENDPRVAWIAERLLGFSPDSKNRVEIADGLEAVKRRLATKKPQYDAALVDCFGGDAQVPQSCRSEEFVAAVHGVIKQGGVVLQNVVGEQSKGVEKLYKGTFGDAAVSSWSVKPGQSLVRAFMH